MAETRVRQLRQLTVLPNGNSHRQYVSAIGVPQVTDGRLIQCVRIGCLLALPRGVVCVVLKRDEASRPLESGEGKEG